MIIAESASDDGSLIFVVERPASMKKTTLALIFLLKLFSLQIYLVQIKRSICDIDFIKHLKKTCETFTGHILFKNCNPSWAARFLDDGRI